MSLEALVRWIRPSYGPISPSVFLPVAEEMRAPRLPLTLRRVLAIMSKSYPPQRSGCSSPRSCPQLAASHARLAGWAASQRQPIMAGVS